MKYINRYIIILIIFILLLNNISFVSSLIVSSKPDNIVNSMDSMPVNTMEVLWSMRALNERVGALSYNKIDELIAVSYDLSKKLVVIDRQGKVMWQYSVDGYICSVDWSPDGKYLSVGTCDWGCSFGSLYLFSKDGSLLWKKSLGGDVKVSWAPSGNKLAAISYEANLVVVYNIFGKELWRKRLSDHLFSISWNPQGDIIAVGTGSHCNPTQPEGSKIYLLDASNGEVIWSSPDLKAGWVLSLRWDPYNNYLYAGTGYSSGSYSAPIYGALVRISINKHNIDWVRHLGFTKYIEIYNNIVFAITITGESPSNRITNVYTIDSNGEYNLIYRQKGSLWWASLNRRGLFALTIVSNSGRETGEVVVIDTNGELVKRLNEYDGCPTGVSWLGDNALVYSTYHGFVRLYSLNEKSYTVPTVTITKTVTRWLSTTKTTTRTMTTTAIVPITVTSTTTKTLKKTITSTLPITSTVTRVFTSTITSTHTEERVSTSTVTSTVTVERTVEKPVTSTITVINKGTVTSIVTSTSTVTVAAKPSLVALTLALLAIIIGLASLIWRK